MRLIALFQDINKITVGKDSSMTMFWLVLGLLYLNMILYLMDLYALVKKKTTGETVMVMLLPGAAAVIGAAMFPVVVDIPASARLEEVWREHISAGLWAELLALAAVFGVLWTLTWQVWKRKRENRFGAAQWIFSYSLDFLMMFLLVTVGGFGLATGADLPVLAGKIVSGPEYNLLLYLFLYGTAALAFKIGLLLAAALTQVYSAKMTHFRYMEGRNPKASYLVYAVFCQNARTRGVLAFWLPMAGFVIWIAKEVDLPVFRGPFPVMVFLTFLLYLLISLGPAARDMQRFAGWGKGLEQFCHEYFLEEPLIKSEDFTVTRHYLVDERGMMRVYYFEALANLKGGWVSDKKGWVRYLYFLDGECCEIHKDDAGAEEIFKYAERYWEMQQLANRSREELLRLQKGDAKEGLYGKLLRVVVAALVMMFLILNRMLQNR